MRIYSPGENNPYGPPQPGNTAILYEIADKDVLIDFGLGLSSRESGRHYFPDMEFIKGKKIDRLILTHFHTDHAGLVVLFHKLFPNVPITMSLPTYWGICIGIEDSLKIWRNEALKAIREGRAFPEAPYSRGDAEAFFESDSIEVIEEPGWYSWDGWDGWKFGFYPAGHERGAMSIFMQTPEKNVFHTGDIASHDQPKVKGVLVPEEKFIKEFLEDAEKKGGLFFTSISTNITP